MKQSRVKNITLHKAIEDEMWRLKMTRGNFAMYIGIDKGMMSNILNGKRYPSLATMEKLISKTRLTLKDWDLSHVE